MVRVFFLYIVFITAASSPRTLQGVTWQRDGSVQLPGYLHQDSLSNNGTPLLLEEEEEKYNDVAYSNEQGQMETVSERWCYMVCILIGSCISAIVR